MTEFCVIDVPLTNDLSDFSRQLWGKNVNHRIVTLEEEERQLLLVGNKEDAEFVHGAYQSLMAGELVWPERKIARSGDPTWRELVYTPVTVICVVLSILGALLVSVDKGYNWVGWLTFFQLDRVAGHMFYEIPNGEYWRLMTPIFLHFGLLHIAFNMIWLWDLGRRVEWLQGSIRMLGIVMVIGLGSNIAQAIYSPAGIFGGMSGVIYGLLGYTWVWSQMLPQHSLRVPNVIMVFMMVWLVLGFTDFAAWMGAGKVANAAHLGGFIMGLIMGLAAATIEKSEQET